MSKLALLRQRCSSRAGLPSGPLAGIASFAHVAAAPSKKGKGSDVRAVVLSSKERWGKPSLVVFVHSLETAKVSEQDRVEDDRLHIKNRAGSDTVTCDPVIVTPFHLIEVTNNSKNKNNKADNRPLAIGDAIWLCNLSAKLEPGRTRTFYDVSFTRMDYTTTGFSALSRSKHSLFYTPRFNPDSYDNDVLLPVAPFPTDDSEIQSPGVYAQIESLDEDRLVQESDNTIVATFGLGVTQWKIGIEEDAVSVRLPSIRCWESTLSAFGMQSPQHWGALAPTVLQNVPFFLKGYVHKDSTASLLSQADTTESDYALSIRVTGLIVDPECMLSKVSLRVPADYALSLLATRSPDASSKGNAWNASEGRFFNASEMPSDADLPAADQWFVLCSVPDLLGSKARLDSLDDAARQAWLEERWCDDTVACVFGRAATKKRKAATGV